MSELPLVVSDKIQEYTKTKQAVLFLRRNKLWGDVLKVKELIIIMNLSIYAQIYRIFEEIYENTIRKCNSNSEFIGVT